MSGELQICGITIMNTKIFILLFDMIVFLKISWIKYYFSYACWLFLAKERDRCATIHFSIQMETRGVHSGKNTSWGETADVITSALAPLVYFHFHKDFHPLILSMMPFSTINQSIFIARGQIFRQTWRLQSGHCGYGSCAHQVGRGQCFPVSNIHWLSNLYYDRKRVQYFSLLLPQTKYLLLGISEFLWRLSFPSPSESWNDIHILFHEIQIFPKLYHISGG